MRIAKLAAALALLLLFAPLSLEERGRGRGSATAAEPPNITAIREAFAPHTPPSTLHSPLVSCWNVNGGWSLAWQVEQIKAGRHYLPTVYVPLDQQGANRQKAWDKWAAEYADELRWINEQRLPVTLRWANWLSELTYPESPHRTGPIADQPVVYRRLADGSLDGGQIVDPFGPVEPWRKEGQRIATSYWIGKLAEALPNVPRLYFLENNEPALFELKSCLEKIQGDTETRRPLPGVPPSAWLPDVESVSVRIAAYAKTHSPAEAEVEIDRRWRILYGALTASLLEYSPAAWRGKITTGGYNGDPALFGQPSYRVYLQGGSGPFDAAAALAHVPPRPLEISLYLYPKWCVENGVTPEQAKSIAATILKERQPRVLRWFAGSTAQLSDPWIAPEKAPPEFATLTVGDYYFAAAAAVEEVHDRKPAGDVVDKLDRAAELIRQAREAIAK